MNTAATAPSISSSASTCIGLGARSRSPSGGRQKTTTPSASSVKSQHANNNATPPAPTSNGCSQPKKPAPKWAAPIPSRPKSHNHCAEVLVRSKTEADILVFTGYPWTTVSGLLGSLPAPIDALVTGPFDREEKQ